MKYAVHVTTRDEQDYVSMKLNNEIYSFKWNYITNDNDSFDDYVYVMNNGYKIISFNEFKSRYELKIGDTFEHNGFVCRVDSEVKKWYLVNVNGVLNYKHLDLKGFCKYNDKNYKIKLITNKEFIKQLEENAR